VGDVTVQVLEAPGKAEGQSKQLDLAKFAYDEHRCVTPPVDPQVLAQLYSRNVAHKACVDAKAVNTVGLGWKFDPKPGTDPADTGVQELAGELEGWLDLLARRDGESFSDLLLSAKKDEEAVGWGAIEISRNGRGQADGLYHVHAFTLRRRKDRDGWVQKVAGDYVYFRNYRRAAADTESPERFEGTNELLIVGETAPDSPFYPLPDHVPALGDIAGDEAAQAYQLQFFRNNAVPRLAIVVEGGKLDEDVKDYLLAYMREGIRGDAHKTLLLESSTNDQVKIHIEKLTVGTSEEADFMAYRRFVVGQVIMSHRVSPSKVTLVEDANRANSRDQDKTFKEQVCKPDQERWEKRIQWLLEDEFGPDLPLQFRFEEMDLADEEQIARTRTHYMGALTNNEVRAFIDHGDAGMDPDTGAVTDPDLEEWGRQPFEAPTPALPGAQEGLGDLEPLSKRVSPVHRAFIAEVAKLGYLVEEIRELAGPDPEHAGY